MLGDAGVPDPATDARTLMAAALGIPRDRLLLRLRDGIDDDTLDLFHLHVAERRRRRPVSQITGRRAFYGREFRVTPDVLDPRPETETLVTAALSAPFDRVLDLGTGTGCIAITLLAERGTATGLATDISEPALAVARANAAALGVADRLDLRLSDWFDAVGGRFDLVVSNPPYIDRATWETLAPEVRDHEPRLALTPGEDGLAPYRVIAAAAPRHLAPGGRLFVETGADQGPAVAEMFRAAGLDAVAIHPDMDGRDRVVSALRSPD
ncbi:peptide chain release factor N(5)-glutamine methyltransferase [Rhodobacterales bacterium HKCCE2091]|nr:peptide chain release factor N(5)-glutamine methyltransferase [Rhodobacterales bacterium HKCCE2091]